MLAPVVLVPMPARAAPPSGACFDPAAGGPVVRTIPWAQQWLGVERAWPLTTGRGVTVAVIDSGVDADHPQLRGAVLRGLDLLGGGAGRADFDCVSHGTAVASLIAARPVTGVGFHGVAPDARILPIRVSERDVGDGGGDAVSPTLFATAIRRAAAAGAGVINLSVVLYRDHPVVRTAVRFAQQRGALLVAAAGNLHRDGTPDPVPYPTAYPGVVGVGAIGLDGSRLSQSPIGPYVDLVAPGGGVLAATRRHGERYWDGTSFATAFVSGAAALVRAAYPKLTAAQVAHRLVATATPAQAGPGYGAGVVDPYRAVTDTVTGEAGTSLPTVHPQVIDHAAQARAAKRHAEVAGARRYAAVAGGLAAIALLASVVLTGARRRRGRATRAAAPAPQPVPDDVPDQIFLLRT